MRRFMNALETLHGIEPRQQPQMIEPRLRQGRVHVRPHHRPS
jgi:hypothetical protein